MNEINPEKLPFLPPQNIYFSTMELFILNQPFPCKFFFQFSFTNKKKRKRQKGILLSSFLSLQGSIFSLPASVLTESEAISYKGTAAEKISVEKDPKNERLRIIHKKETVKKKLC